MTLKLKGPTMILTRKEKENRNALVVLRPTVMCVCLVGRIDANVSGSCPPSLSKEHVNHGAGKRKAEDAQHRKHDHHKCVAGP